MLMRILACPFLFLALGMVVEVSPQVSLAGDLWEPNDTREKAVELDTPEGSQREPRVAASLDSVGSIADEDWYFREGSSLHEKWVSVWIEPIEVSFLDTEIEIFEWNNPARVAHNDDIRTGSPAIRQSGLAGVAIAQDASPVLHVYPWNHSEAIQGGYRLNTLSTLNHANFEDAESEPNDTINESDFFPIGHNVTGQISSAGDVDWLKVGKTFPTNEDLLIVLKNESGGSADFQVRVFDTNGANEFTGIALSGGVGEHDFLRIPYGSHVDDYIAFEIRSVTGTGNYRLFFGVGMTASCPVPYRSSSLDLPTPIPDWSGGLPGSVSDTIQIPAGAGTVSDLRVFLDVSHDYLLDLEVKLRHLDTGSQVLLFDRACETSDNISTIFDDAAPRRVCPPVELSATPDAALSRFNGESAEGDWMLIVSDVAPGNSGYLNQWALLIPTQVPTPTPTSTVTPTPTLTRTPRVFDCNSPYTSAPVLPVPDASATSPKAASDTITVPDTGAIEDLNVFVDVSHEYIADLIVRLDHVDSGNTVFLYDQTCTPAKYVDIFTVFDDEGAPFQVPGSCPPDDPSNPDQPWNAFNLLDAFDGESIAGDWILTVTDANQGTSGTLNKWCLIATLATPTKTPTPTQTPTATIFFDCNSPYSQEPNAAIPDATGATTGVLEATMTIVDHRTIGDLNVFVSIDHENIVDLGLSLENVDTGLSTSLYTSGCPQGTALFTVFDDDGSPLSCPPTDPNAPIQTDNPFARLDSFDGMDLAGDWKLNVADLGVGRTGTLNKWCLIVTDATTGPSLTPTQTLTPTPTRTQTGGPSPTVTPTCANSADLNSDGEYDARDLLELLRQIRGRGITAGYSSADLNCDSKVNDVDLLILQKAWKP